MFQSRTISIQIQRDYDEVYDFLATPRNLQKWSAGMGATFEYVSGSDWAVDHADGPMIITFAEYNKYGILDHVLAPIGGTPRFIPMRVFRNGEGAEILYTLFRMDNHSQEQFDSEIEWVLVDLGALKSLLENE
jgi:hypothetical protein